MLHRKEDTVVKKYAIFLPQFHSIPENDEWWGNGFTEWTKVKEAIPLFAGHSQPKVPIDNNYYNLLDRETVEWHTRLLRKYHVDGLAYYHYYFNGKLLLEKPAENLLKWKNIKQNFFFIWANHSWIRSWEGRQDILMEQEYGDKNNWEQHFRYLIPFFKDERYEKKDNKPLFALFDSNFSCKNNMFKYFEKRCREEGFSGIYLIEYFAGDPKCNIYKAMKKFAMELCDVTCAVHIRMPGCAERTINGFCGRVFTRSIRKLLRGRYNKSHILYKMRGDILLKKMEHICFDTLDRDIIPGVFFEWDNTPRHRYRGYIISPVSKSTFFEYMNSVKSRDYILINAWNEWAEGMILEPTQENGYKYLEWIKEWTEQNEVG